MAHGLDLGHESKALARFWWGGRAHSQLQMGTRSFGRRGALLAPCYKQVAGKSNRGSQVLVLACLRPDLGHCGLRLENVADPYCKGEAKNTVTYQFYSLQKCYFAVSGKSCHLIK